MGLIILGADGEFDEEASARANAAHLRMYQDYVEACLGEKGRSEAENAADAAEVLSLLAGNAHLAETALDEAQSAAAQSDDSGGYAVIVNLLRASA